MSETTKNTIIYIMIGFFDAAAVWAAASIGAGQVDWFDPAVHPEAAQYKGLALALLGFLLPIVTTWLAANRPKWSHSEQSALTDQVGHKRAIVALRSEQQRQIDADKLPDDPSEVGGS